MYNLLYPKNDESLIVIDDFYSMPNESLDVIFLGSSRNIMNINPAVIWQESGIKSFALGATGQPLWNSYHYLVEALKTQSPELVVLEVGLLSYPEEYSEYNFIVKNNLGLKLSINRYDSISASAPMEIRTDLLFKFPVFHDRYDELTVTDFSFGLLEKDISYRGFTPSGTVNAFEKPIDNSGDTKFEIPLKNKEYLQKIVDLCNEKNIQLLLLATPDLITEVTGWSEMCDSISNEVTAFAMDNNINYLYTDMVVDEIGIDYATDFRDDRHLNVIGAEKLSIYLSEYIMDNYYLELKNVYNEDWEYWASQTMSTIYEK